MDGVDDEVMDRASLLQCLPATSLSAGLGRGQITLHTDKPAALDMLAKRSQNCQHKFDDLAKDPRFRYFGNVLVTSQPSIPTSSSCTPTTSSTSTLPPGGSSSTQPSTALSPYTYPQALRLPLSSLTPHYNALLLSYGASLSNPLSSVPGSSSSSSPLRNVHPALALVGWYNGHPAFADLPIDLRGISDVSIVGQGNVALDVARILLKHVDDLRGTDVPEHVLQVLAESDVRRVSAAGRRGPGQVAFTTKEFREMGQLPNVGFRGIDPALQVQAEGMVKGDRMRTRLLALMAKLAGQKGEKEFVLDFLKSPKAFIDRGDGSVGEVEWVHNELVRSGDGEGAGWNARETEERGTMRTDMVVESVGYRSEPLGPVGGDVWALPFDERRGRVVNVGGRVVGESGEHVRLIPSFDDELSLHRQNAIAERYERGLADQKSTGPRLPHFCLSGILPESTAVKVRAGIPYSACLIGSSVRFRSMIRLRHLRIQQAGTDRADR